ncbi:hypothetical protein LMH73_023870, partial [Vibrio splendidus]
MSDKRRYFGTDGVRGKVGQYPITPDFVLKLGWAAGRVLAKQGTKKVIIGRYNFTLYFVQLLEVGCLTTMPFRETVVFAFIVKRFRVFV